MVKFYLTRIKQGKMTIEQVPDRWYTDVLAAVIREGE